MTRTTPVSRTAVVLLAAVASTGLASCSVHPGQAAVVGSEAISESRIDEVATVLCSAQSSTQQQGQTQEQSSKSNRQLALGLTIDNALTRRYAADKSIQPDRAQVERAVASQAQLVDAVPAGDRSVLSSTLRDLAENQVVLAEVGRGELEKGGTKSVNPSQAIQAGTQARNDWTNKHVKVSVDPRYGTFSRGVLTGRSGSLSAAVSSQSVDGAKEQPPATWVSSLPASQKCS